MQESDPVTFARSISDLQSCRNMYDIKICTCGLSVRSNSFLTKNMLSGCVILEKMKFRFHGEADSENILPKICEILTLIMLCTLSQNF